MLSVNNLTQNTFGSGYLSISLTQGHSEKAKSSAMILTLLVFLRWF